eukprot:1987856-Amphidinium_carterae.2
MSRTLKDSPLGRKIEEEHCDIENFWHTMEGRRPMQELQTTHPSQRALPLTSKLRVSSTSRLSVKDPKAISAKNGLLWSKGQVQIFPSQAVTFYRSFSFLRPTIEKMLHYKLLA